MKSKKKVLLSKYINNTLLLIFYSTFLFVFSIAFLLSTPKFLSALESSFFVRGETDSDKLPVAVSDITPDTKPDPVIITDSKIVHPEFTALAVLSEDFDSGQIFYQKNIHARLAPASTTKIMTAIVALDHYKYSDVLTVTPESTVNGSTMGLVAGETITFRNVLLGMMLNSGNDAAYTIALNYPGGLKAFVAAMNQKAKDLGLNDTHFQNPAGFDSQSHYSSAYDLSIIAKTAALNLQLSRVFSTQSETVTSVDGKKVHKLQNLNELLGKDGVIGIKTGYTEKAGENFVGLANKNNHKVLTVVLDSTNRFQETKTLLDWTYQNFHWQNSLY